MVVIDNEEVREQVLEYLTVMKQEQMELQRENPTIVLYCSIPLRYAVKHKMVLTPFLTHKFVVRQKPYHELSEEITSDQDILDLVTSVLDYELTCPVKDATFSSEDINKVVKLRKRLDNKVNKKNDGPANKL